MRKRIMMTCLVSALMLATGTARAQNRITATRTQSPPVIDGRLDDACWAEAVAVSSFLKMNSTTPAEAKTEAYVLFDERSLYLGFRCYEPDVSTIQTGKRTRGEMVFRDDCVEVMLDPWLSRDEYFHFAVNASGSQYDSFCSQGGHVHEPSWDGDWEAAASIGEGEWTAELRIPFYTLGIRPGVGSIWGINLMREKKLPYPENSSIATQGAFHIAGRFAELVGLDANLSRYCYEIGTSEKAIGTAEGMISAVFKVPVTNLTGSDSTVRVDGWLIDELKRVRSATALHSFQAGERAEIDIGPVQLEGAGTYELVITIKDETTRETLAIQKSGLSIDAVPMAVHVIEPFYRNAIFATQNLREVVLDIEITLSEEEITDKHLAVHVKDGDGAEIFPTTRISPLERMNRFRFPVEGLPHGEIHVHALLEAPAGQVARTSQRLRNLPYKPGEVWLGRNLNWHVDGNPFFPIASWGHQEDTDEF